MLRTILPIIFLLFPFLSCSDDKNDIIPSVAIVGTWNRTNVVFEGMDDPGFDVVKFSFDADKHFVSYYSDGDICYEGVYEIGNDYLRLEFYDENGEYQKALCEILSFDDSNIKVQYKFEYKNQEVKVTICLQKK